MKQERQIPTDPQTIERNTAYQIGLISVSVEEYRKFMQNHGKDIKEDIQAEKKG